MNPLVLAFFLHNVLATFFLGMKFRGRPDPAFKNFGSALLLNSVAFAVWSIAVVLRPQNLELFITIGAVFFIASLIAFFSAGIQNIDKSKRQSLILIGSVVAIILFLLRAFAYTSNPGFSPEGLFFFNPHPIMQIIYIFALALTALPAIDAVASKLVQPAYSRLVRYGFIAQVMGGVILITSTDTLVLFINGWIIGIVYLLLWTSLLFSKKAWSAVN